MAAIEVSIVEFIDDGYPGFAKAVLTDAYGKQWMIEDKVPYMSDENSTFPFTGRIHCKIKGRFTDTDGGNLVRIDISEPIYMQSEDGTSVFDVLEEQTTL